MALDHERKEKAAADTGQILSLLRPAVKQLAGLHHMGKVHGEIRPESVVIRNHIRFCFPLPENAVKAYTTEQKVFVSLEEPAGETGGQEAEKGSQSGSGKGRPLFCVPLEQLFAEIPANPRADVYSMCAVLYQRLTGTEPADARSRLAGAEVKKPSELGIRIGERQEAALMKGLSILGQDRYEDGGGLYRELYEEVRTENGHVPETDGKETAEKTEKVHHSEQETAGSGEKESKNDMPEKRIGGALREGWQVTDDAQEIEKLRGITFLDFISPEASGKWDVSQNRDGSVMAWLEKSESGGEECWELYIGADGGVKAAANSEGLFQDCKYVEEILFNGNFDTSNVTDMTAMFSGCGNLLSLDVSDFDTSHVTSMADMFACCARLTRLDVSGFDTSRVEDMSGMFYDCSSLEELDISHFDMSSVDDDRDMLTGTRWEEPDEEEEGQAVREEDQAEDEWMKEIDRLIRELSQNPTAARKKGSMLRDAFQIRFELRQRENTYGVAILENLRSVIFLDRIPALWAGESWEEGCWDVSQNRDGSVMALLEKQGSGDGEYYELYIGAEGGVQAAVDSRGLFQDCRYLERISFNGNFDTSETVSMERMFEHCKSLQRLDISSFDTSGVKNMSYMFHGCESLRSLDMGELDTSQTTTMSFMFSGCKSLTALDVSSFDTSRVTSMAFMFSGCKKLAGLDVSGFRTSRVKSMNYMFADCSSLENLDISGFDMSSVTEQKEMLRGTKGRWKGIFSRLFRS